MKARAGLVLTEAAHEGARRAGTHRRRRARRLPGRRGQGGARHPRQPGQESVPDPVRHLGGGDQRHHAGGVRRRFQPRRGQPARGVGEHALPPHLPHRPRAHPAQRRALAGRDDAAVAPKPGVAARQRAAEGHAGAHPAVRAHPGPHRLGRALRGQRHRLGLYDGPERVVLPGRLGAGRLGAQPAHRRGGVAQARLPARLQRPAVHFPGGQGAPRVLRRRLDAPDRADQPGAAPGRGPGAGRRHRAADARTRRARARTSTRRWRRSPAMRSTPSSSTACRSTWSAWSASTARSS